MSSYADWSQRFSRHLKEKSQRVFKRDELHEIFYEKSTAWGAPQTLRVSRLIEMMLKKEDLNKIELSREGTGGNVQTKIRYAIGDVSPFAIGQSLVKDAYISHSSAMFLHNLSDETPTSIYVNREQSVKPKSTLPLSQVAIDRAFKRAPRTSNYVFTSEETRFVLLSGKNTGRLEVASIRAPFNETVDATKLERTLIDIVVRPVYAGGPTAVLHAYRAAASRLSVDTLLATLLKLDYTYPYHQVIGFLLQRVGIPKQQMTRLEAREIQWNFYLAHKMKEPQYDSRWRLFFPQNFDSGSSIK